MSIGLKNIALQRVTKNGMKEPKISKTNRDNVLR